MTQHIYQTLAGIVTNDHRAATVLEQHQLDYCCKGKRTLAEACNEKGLSVAEIAGELDSLNDGQRCISIPFSKWSAEQLIQHIVSRHHAYVKQIMPQLFIHLEKVAFKHGDRYPEMIEVFTLFSQIREEMTAHMEKEEMVLFPAIMKAEAATANNYPLPGEVRIISEATRMMEHEHDDAGTGMMRIRELTNNYNACDGVCTTFRVSIAELKEFEEDLHQHVHLENNILFPMANSLLNNSDRFLS